MFLIGAPLGAIIKKGGLGIPLLIAILFFIVYYVISIMGEKYARELADAGVAGYVAGYVGATAGGAVLSLPGLATTRACWSVDFWRKLPSGYLRIGPCAATRKVE